MKTNRRDARNLGRLYRAGELTVIEVPDEKQEALRDLTRAREDVREDLTCRQHRLNRFLVRQGYHYQDGDRWTQKHWAWIRKIRCDDENAQMVLDESIRAVEQSQEQLKTFDAKLEENAQKPEYAKKVARYATLRGVKTVTALTIIAEVGDMRRYETAPQFMGSTGLVPSEHSTGNTNAAARSPKPAMRICGACWWKPHGITAIVRIPANPSRNVVRDNPQPWSRSPSVQNND